MSDPAERLSIDAVDDRFVLVGEIDAHTAPVLAERLAAATPARVVLDLGGVSFMDSSGVRVIVDAHARAGDAGGELVLRSPSRAVRRVLDVSGLTDHLNLVDD